MSVEKNNKKTLHALHEAFFYGATGRIRTGDLLITNQLLYRLSHGSINLATDSLYYIAGKKATVFFIRKEKF